MAEFTAAKPKTVMVSGCYDLLHSGHVAFFKEASGYGDLHVSVGSDANILLLKHHKPMFPEDERLYMVKAISYVHDAFVCTGSGMLDFEADLDILKPDCFVVNEDGDRATKKEACLKRDIEYIVLKRVPDGDLQERSSTAIKAVLATPKADKKEQEENHVYEDEKEKDLVCFPWRVCLAGGWLDQPKFSSLYPGPVIVVNIHPHMEFKTRSGLATSTRFVGMDLWGTRFGGKPPVDAPNVNLAKFLFGAENPPGCEYVAGSQDALGLMLPGINRLDYNGAYWPDKVHTLEGKSAHQTQVMQWLERVLWLVPLPSRPDGYDPLVENNATEAIVKSLADACDRAWKAIQLMDASLLGQALKETMKAWSLMLPATVPPASAAWCAPYEGSHGYLFSGAGGGFLMVISDEPVERGFHIQINNNSFWDTHK